MNNAKFGIDGSHYQQKVKTWRTTWPVVPKLLHLFLTSTPGHPHDTANLPPGKTRSILQHVSENRKIACLCWDSNPRPSSRLTSHHTDYALLVVYKLKSTWNFVRQGYHIGVRSGAVGWGTALQVGRSRVRFRMVSLEFFIDIILPAAVWPWGWLSL